MKKNKNTPIDLNGLRSQAEDRLDKGGVAAGEGGTAPQNQRLLHELQVHQIELQMQNEELLRARAEVEEGLSRYTDLYELAPVGYLTLGRDGRILRVNLTATRMLGLERSRLIGMQLGHLLATEHRIVFGNFLENIFSGPEKAVCEVILRPQGASPLVIDLTGTASQDGQECRVVATNITESKRAEEALQESEETFRALAENANDGILVASGKGAHVFANRRAAEILGYSVAELLKTTIKDLAHPDEIQKLTQRYAQRLAGESIPAQYESALVGKDKARIPVEMTATKIAWHGQPADMVIVRDITARKKAEAVLKESEEKFRTIFESSSAAMAIIEKDTTISMVNREYCRISGYQEKDVVGMSWTKQIPPGDLERLQEYNRKRLIDPTSAPDRYEFTFFRKDGQIRHSLMSVAMIPMSQKILCSFIDITERKRAETELRISEQRLRRFFESGLIGVIYWNMNGQISDANDKFLEMVGYTRAELEAGQISWVHLTPPEYKVLDDRSVAELKVDGISRVPQEKEYIRKDGTRIPILLAAAALDEGRDEGVGFVMDITERKKIQASLAQADRLASMGMLAAGVAHEVNNPLAYVIFNNESLAQDLPKVIGAAKRCGEALRKQVGEEAFAKIVGDDALMLQPAMLDDTAERAREALAGALRIKNISRGLGTFSRVEQIDLSLVDINFAIDCALQMATNEIKYRATLVKDLGQVSAVWASEGKLSQVFLNLIINAAHAIDEGHVKKNHIKIRTWAEGQDVFAQVEDTGKGIPAENLERIFEPFFTTKPMGSGSGLGLSICKNIVTGFGGDIRVESEVGKGARFIIRLPAKSDETPKEQRDIAALDTSQVPAAHGRILAVDDEEGIRKAVMRVLGKQHEVVLAQSGEEAQAIIEKDQAFDLILCDLMMPKVTGMELHAWLLARNPALAAKMVFLTGGAFTPKAAQYMSGVPNLKIEKPFDLGSFKKLIQERIQAEKSKN